MSIRGSIICVGPNEKIGLVQSFGPAFLTQHLFRCGLGSDAASGGSDR